MFNNHTWLGGSCIGYAQIWIIAESSIAPLLQTFLLDSTLRMLNKWILAAFQFLIYMRPVT